MNSYNSTLAGTLLVEALNNNSAIPFLIISQKSFINLFQIKDEAPTTYNSKASGIWNLNNSTNESLRLTKEKLIKFGTQLIESKKVKLASK